MASFTVMSLVVSLALVISCVFMPYHQCSAASIVKEGYAPCFAERENSPYIDSLPHCDEMGFYKALQVYMDRFSCFTRNGNAQDVSPFNPLFHTIGPCRTLKQCVRRNQAQGAQEHKLIRCDSYGFFKPVQKTKDGNICVNLYGHFFKTSGINSKRDCLDLSIVSAF